MVAGLLIVIYAMIPFFMIFERRKPKAREIVLVAMMTALTVTSHLLFHVTIPIEIGTAMVIISGISLGPEAGFGRGAGAFWFCNFYQGSTLYPVADVLLGLAWLLAGLAFNKVEAQHLKLKSQKEVDAARGRGGETGRNRHSAWSGNADVHCIRLRGGLYLYLIVPGRGSDTLGLAHVCLRRRGTSGRALLQRKRLPVDNITITLFTFLQH